VKVANGDGGEVLGLLTPVGGEALETTITFGLIRRLELGWAGGTAVLERSRDRVAREGLTLEET
jgi:hypothetical protein